MENDSEMPAGLRPIGRGEGETERGGEGEKERGGEGERGFEIPVMRFLKVTWRFAPGEWLDCFVAGPIAMNGLGRGGRV